MNPEKMPDFSVKIEKKQESLGLKLISEQLKEAISKEDYEQAAFLRDTHSQLAKNQSLSYIRPEDILSEIEIAERKLGVTDEDEDEDDNFRVRAWKGIESKQMAEMFAGKNLVKESVFADYLKNDGRYMFSFVDELWENIRIYKHYQEPDEKAEFIASLYNNKNEAKDLVELAKNKIDSIHQAYSERAPISRFDDEKLARQFPGVPAEQAKLTRNIQEMPDFINKPLKYWRGIYDNASKIVGELETALKEMN